MQTCLKTILAAGIAAVAYAQAPVMRGTFPTILADTPVAQGGCGLVKGVDNSSTGRSAANAAALNTCIAAAVSAGATGGGTIQFGAGTYMLSNWQFSASNWQIVGAGGASAFQNTTDIHSGVSDGAATVLMYPSCTSCGGGTTYVVRMGQPNAASFSQAMRHLVLDANSANGSASQGAGRALLIQNSVGSKVDDVGFIRANGDGAVVVIADNHVSPFWPCGSGSGGGTGAEWGKTWIWATGTYTSGMIIGDGSAYEASCSGHWGDMWIRTSGRPGTHNIWFKAPSVTTEFSGDNNVWENVNVGYTSTTGTCPDGQQCAAAISALTCTTGTCTVTVPSNLNLTSGQKDGLFISGCNNDLLNGEFWVTRDLFDPTKATFAADSSLTGSSYGCTTAAGVGVQFAQAPGNYFKNLVTNSGWIEDPADYNITGLYKPTLPSGALTLDYEVRGPFVMHSGQNGLPKLFAMDYAGNMWNANVRNTLTFAPLINPWPSAGMLVFNSTTGTVAPTGAGSVPDYYKMIDMSAATTTTPAGYFALYLADDQAIGAAAKPLMRTHGASHDLTFQTPNDYYWTNSSATQLMKLQGSSGTLFAGLATPDHVPTGSLIPTLELTSNDPTNHQVNLTLQGTGKFGAFTCETANGTPGSPTALTNGIQFCVLAGRGYTGTGWTTAGSAAITFVTTENWNSAAIGGGVTIESVPNGDTNRFVALTVRNYENSGNVIATTQSRDGHFADLPACTSATRGMEANVDDATIGGIGNFWAVVSSGGSNAWVGVKCDGVNWRIH